MQRFQSLTCPALLLGALLFAAGAGAADKPDRKKAEERKTETERPNADKPDGKKPEERKTEPERPDADKPGGKKSEERKTEPERPDADESGGKRSEEPKTEPERRSVDKPDGKKAEERKTEPERPDADKPAKKTTGPELMTFDFTDTPMTEAVFEFQRMSGLNIVLHADLARTNPRISLRVKNMRMGSALNWICTLADARYVLVDRAIYIIPKSKIGRGR